MKLYPYLTLDIKVNLIERSKCGDSAKWLWCWDEFFKHDTKKAQTIKETKGNAEDLKIKILAGTGDIINKVKR